MNQQDYLNEFKSVAQDWFAKNTFLQDFHKFFTEFFKKENLEKAEWPDFQKMGDHIHSFNALAIAKGNALGKPNHPIEHYRKSFIFLAYGDATPEERIRHFATDEEYKLKYFGNSALSEIFAWAFPDRFVMFNYRDVFAAELLEIKLKSPSVKGFIGKFLSFNEDILPVMKEYENVVGRQTDLPLAVEFDQFFSYLYEKYHKAKDTGKPPETQYWLMAPGENAKYWNECIEKGIILYGADELSDLSTFNSKKEIAAESKKVLNLTHDPIMDGLAAWQFAHEIKIGDFILAKKGVQEIIGYGQVTSEYYWDESRSTYRNVLDIKWLKTGHWPAPKGIGLPVKTLTKMTKKNEELLDWILPLVQQDSPDEPKEEKPSSKPEPYTISDALADLFLKQSDFDEILYLLKTKKNIILQGPPGVGKSFIAKRVAYALIGRKAPANVEMIQFHQAYSYEDFIQGYRPEKNGGFYLKDGIFYDFCRKAAEDSGTPYVFIIDEINRGNLSKIFGELMLLVEADKRSSEFALALTYSQADADRFYIPPNLHLIGMMNTADRSLAMVDYALRRRFSFVDLKPEFGSPKFKEYLTGQGVSGPIVDKVIKRMEELNIQITQDNNNLGRGYCIGHSFFCPEAKSEYGEEWYNRVVTYEIAPLIREYWFDKPEKATSTIERLIKPA